MQQLGKKKASSVAARLNLSSPYAKVVGIGASIEELDEKELGQILEADVVWDCTANDEVLRHVGTIRLENESGYPFRVGVLWSKEAVPLLSTCPGKFVAVC